LLASRRPLLQVLRGTLLCASSVVFYQALRHMPLAEASAISFTAPMIVAALAGPVLGERVSRATWRALLAGFAGVLLIIRPGSGIFSAWAALPLLTALLVAGYQLMTRVLAATERTRTSLFYPALIGSVGLGALSPFSLAPPHSLLDAALFAALGALGATGNLCLIRAYALAPATRLAPLTYAQFGGVLVFGYLLFGQFPDRWSLLGMLVIALSGLSLIAARH
jgi:drug/metabolite transporter (DMT)-like permease